MAALVTAAQLQRFAPKCDFLALGPALDRACQRFGVTTPLRIAHFMGQMHHESRGLTRLEEDLDYSAKRLTEVWPNRYPTLAAAQPYAHNPRKLANHTYGGRLGNSGPNDGWLYRGGGLLMNTGKGNFAEIGILLGLDLVTRPELLRTPAVAALAAGAHWAKEGLNRFADADDVSAVTRGVQGGQLGLADRKAQTARAKTIWR